MKDRHPLEGPLDAASTASTEPLILDLLDWLAAGPRPYDEVMEAWRTSCPRLTIWEDCVDHGYVARSGGGRDRMVELTELGRQRLGLAAVPAP
jgi:hypothetical protein